VPPQFPDDEVRAAAIVFVQTLRERHGGRIPAKELSAGIQLRGERVPIWNYQKGIFKPAATGPAGAALSVQTSAESPYGDVHDPEAGLIHYKYRGTDPQQADNVALRRAYVEQRPIIYLVAVDQGFYDAVAPVYVTGDDPVRLQFTLMADQLYVPPTLADPVMTAARREYATRAVLQRLHQHHFRQLVLSAYANRCAICSLRHRELLDAAHILPDRDPRGEPAVSNGLGLCKIHHSAYDVHIIGIDPDARVHVRQDILEEKDGPMLRHGLQEVEGTKLYLPRREELKPNREFLAERFDRFRAA
jgi:putative restriction endonuclease